MNHDVLFESQGQIGLITLARPEALNALTLSMIRAMKKQLEAWEKDPKIQAIVLQAEPGKAFCAGGDVRWLYEQGKAKSPECLAFFQEEYQLNEAIAHFPKPYIALMDGITMGGGVGISLHGSHPVASQRFVFAMPETGIGLFPDIGASYLLSRLPSAWGLYLALTGNRVSESKAYALGLVKYVIEAESFPELIVQIQETDLSQDAHARLHALLSALGAVPKSNLKEETAQIEAYFSEKCLSRIFSKLGESQDLWALDTLKHLEQKSPISLMVTFAQMKAAKNLSLEECLRMDYGLVQHFMAGKDFYEGVRALLIDKDKEPKWQVEDIEEVSDAMVADYFR